MKTSTTRQLLEEQFLGLATRHAPLSDSIRLGAQLMLQKAVELEVTEFLGRDHYQRRGAEIRQGYRNGYEDKQVQTAEGPLYLKMPQVRDTIEGFDSVWLRALVRRSDKLAALIPQLYVKGLSTRDIETALSDTLEVEGVSKSTVSTLCGQLKYDFEQWQNRDLSEHKILYLFCDGIYLRLRPDDERAAAVLCAYGIREHGRKALLHLAVGNKEKHGLLEEFLPGPEAARTGRAALGHHRREQRVAQSSEGVFSWVMGAAVSGSPDAEHSVQAARKGPPGIKKLLHKAFTAQSQKAGLEQTHGLVAMYEQEYPEAMKCLRADSERSASRPFSSRNLTGNGSGQPTCWNDCLARVGVDQR